MGKQLKRCGLFYLLLVAALVAPTLSAELAAPADLATPPDDAERTSTGLRTKVLAAGSGDRHPTAADSVVVRYTSWTSDGEMAESSVAGTNSSRFGIEAMCDGFKEGLRLMVAGEKRRMWLPDELGYRGQYAKPEGPLVYDAELVEIILPPKAPADVAEPPRDAQRLESGLYTKLLREGTGTVRATPDDIVVVEHATWQTNGSYAMGTHHTGKPMRVSPHFVFPGWTEAMTMMVAGEKRRFWIPEELAYRGRADAPSGMLVSDIELVDMILKPEPPADLTTPPKDALVSASGLVTKRLSPGSGRRRPSINDNVSFHYHAWTTEGRLFDSSILRDEPEKMRLSKAMAGLQEGLKQMVAGEKRRFWIPQELSFNDQRRLTEGTVVYDVELLFVY